MKLKIKSWGFILPAVLLISLFVFYPMVRSLFMSFESGAGTNLQWVGLGNFERMLTDTLFHSALFNTVLYLIIQVPIMTLLALIMASMLNDRKLKGKGFFRTAIFLPCVTGLVAYSIIFRGMFANDGVINDILMNLSIIDSPINWLTSTLWARVLIIIAITWRWTGYNMIFYLAGLQGIDRSVYEAAEIDGAGIIQRFKSITLPMLKPIILFTTINSTIGTLQLFDESMNITGGGPANATITISHYIYNVMFRFTPNFGYAAALSYVIVAMIVLLAFIQLKVGDKND